uniref:Uncharacterized protein n=1 Tax=Anguilla anguilla TaxID=7936 RepID=A0A0E9T8I8_ANGAN
MWPWLCSGEAWIMFGWSISRVQRLSLRKLGQHLRFLAC